MDVGHLKINKGFYYGAGSPKKYNWVKDGFHIYGVGIDIDLLKQYQILQIEVNNQVYGLDTTKAINFIKKYRSLLHIKGTILGVVSKSLLTNDPYLPT